MVGPTASGKTELAIALAQQLGTEIVNADARQVYQWHGHWHSPPFCRKRSGAKHHLVDFPRTFSALYSAGI